MNRKFYNCNSLINLKYNNIDNNYFLYIKDNNTNSFSEIYITENEFNIIKTAIKHNNGIINLLNHKEEIYSLYRKGLVEISDDELEVVKVSDLMVKALLLKAMEDQNILLSLKDNNNGMIA